MDFSQALLLLKAGGKVARNGWNGKGMWLTLSPGGHIPAEKFWAPHNRAFAEQQPDGHATVAPYITMKDRNGYSVPWLANQTDLLAEDWFPAQ
jgi:hypothetical protein